MPLGKEVGLGPDDVVLDGGPVPPKRGTAPNFRPVSVVAKRSPISATAELLFLFCLFCRHSCIPVQYHRDILEGMIFPVIDRPIANLQCT